MKQKTPISGDLLNLEIISSKVLEGVPSASGVVKYGTQYLVIGDNSPFLFTLNSDFELVSKSLFFSPKKLSGDTFLKKDKPDFEAMEMLEDQSVLIFCSGSKSPQRDYCLRFKPEDVEAAKCYGLTDFYAQLKQSEILDNQELNIEALAVQQDRLYLFNRGRNVIFSFNSQDILDHFEGRGPFPKLQNQLFQLPKITGKSAGFSGATAFPNKPYLIFTASVEDTDNAYDDGEVLGSFIGLIGLEAGIPTGKMVYTRIPDWPIPLKVESVVIDQEISPGVFNILLVTDSDGASSMLLKCQLTC